jgi:hypothetical protein
LSVVTAPSIGCAGHASTAPPALRLCSERPNTGDGGSVPLIRIAQRNGVRDGHAGRDGRLSNGHLARGSFFAQGTMRGQPHDRAPDSEIENLANRPSALNAGASVKEFN